MSNSILYMYDKVTNNAQIVAKHWGGTWIGLKNIDLQVLFDRIDGERWNTLCENNELELRTESDLPKDVNLVTNFMGEKWN